MGVFMEKKLQRRFSLALVSLLVLLVAGCARRVARVESVAPAITGPAALAVPAGERPAVEADQEKDREDSPGEAAEYEAQKRAVDGKSEVPVERYLAAKERMGRMRAFSLGTGRFSNSKQERQISIGAWTELGPSNIAGRARTMVFDPADATVAYVGAAAGGVWKTTNGGANWTPLTDLLPNLAVNALAIDPKAGGTLYAGTGEGFGNADAVRGVGIFKTTDGGATWTHLEATRGRTEFFFVNKLVVSPNDSQRVYAATSVGVFRSMDGGETWSAILERRTPFNGCQDLVIRTDQPGDVLFAACGRGSTPTGIFRTVSGEGEAKWEMVLSEPNMSRSVIALAPSNQGIVYVMSASQETGRWRDGLLAVFRSEANGDPGSFTVRVRNTDAKRLNTVLLTNTLGAFDDICSPGREPDFGNQGWYDIALAVDPVNPDRLWAGGIDLFRSEDGGANWGLASHWWVAKANNTNYAHADQHAIYFHPQYNGESNKQVYFLNDGGVFRTDDSLGTVITENADACFSRSRMRFQELSNGMVTTQFYNGVPYPGGHFYWGGMQDNGTNRGGDAAGKDQWARVIGGDGGYVAVAPEDANRIYAETTRLSLRRATNGLTFSAATRGITDASTAANFLFIVPFKMDPNQSQRLWLAGRILWRTDDGASNWVAGSTPLPTGLISAIAVAPGNSNRVLFGTNTGRVYRNEAAGEADSKTEWEFTRVRLNGVISSLEFDPNNQDVVYATVSTFNNADGEGHVFRSTDGGVSWSSLDGSGDTGVPDLPAHSIAVDPANSQAIYLGSDAGIFVSVDGGASWAKEDVGFVNTVVEALHVIRENGASTLYAFTRGRGAWSVRLNGETGLGCEYKVSAVPAMTAYGGFPRVRVETGEECRWSAVAGATWASPSVGSGKGPGELPVQVQINAATGNRTSSIQVANQRVIVAQSGAPVVSGNISAATAAVVTTLPYAVLTVTNRLNPPGEDSPVHSCTESRDSRATWFRYTPNFSGTLYVSSYTGTATGAFGGNVITAYEGADAASAVGNEKACVRSTTQPVLNLPVEAGKTYWIQSSGLGANNVGGTQVFLLGRLN
jgi:photosystem II stability/assembly factor-like uncharacterized protein